MHPDTTRPGGAGPAILLLALELLTVILAGAAALPLSAPTGTDGPGDAPTTPSTTTERAGLGQQLELRKLRSKKLLSHVDHKSELDHRDYVVSDREFELVLRRFERGELVALAVCSSRDHQLATLGPDGARATPARGECECPICLEDLPERADSAAEVTLLCGHKFHLRCIADWARARQPRSACCPVCIGSMRLKDGRRVAD